MFNLLLATGDESTLAVAIMLFIMALGILLFSYLKKKSEKAQNELDFSSYKGKIHVSLKHPYMPPKAFAFFNALQRALPLNVIAFPKVGVDNLVEPAGDLVAYKAIQAKYVDFAVFDKYTMKPLAVVDLVDPALAAGSIIQQDAAITKSLSTVNLPVLEFKVQKDYSEKEILGRFLESQDPYTIAQMKAASKK